MENCGSPGDCTSGGALSVGNAAVSLGGGATITGAESKGSGAGVAGVGTSGACGSIENCGSPGDCASGGTLSEGSAAASLGGGGTISGAESTGSGAGVAGVSTSGACGSMENCGSPDECASGGAVENSSASGNCVAALSGSAADWDWPPFRGISWRSDPGPAPELNYWLREFVLVIGHRKPSISRLCKGTHGLAQRGPRRPYWPNSATPI